MRVNPCSEPATIREVAMFWIGFIVGMFAGTTLGVVVMSSASLVAHADRLDDEWNKRHGDYGNM